MLSGYRLFILPLTALLIIFGCNSTSSDPGDDSFEAFYKKFHEDTAYQIRHITFPLEGIPAFADSAEMYDGTFRWTKEDWVYHRITDSLQQNFEREFISLGNDLILEQLTHKSARIGMERRYAKLGDGWNLIYYAGMNYVR